MVEVQRTRFRSSCLWSDSEDFVTSKMKQTVIYVVSITCGLKSASETAINWYWSFWWTFKVQAYRLVSIWLIKFFDCQTVAHDSSEVTRLWFWRKLTWHLMKFYMAHEKLIRHSVYICSKKKNFNLTTRNVDFWNSVLSWLYPLCLRLRHF